MNGQCVNQRYWSVITAVPIGSRLSMSYWAQIHNQQLLKKKKKKEKKSRQHKETDGKRPESQPLNVSNYHHHHMSLISINMSILDTETMRLQAHGDDHYPHACVSRSHHHSDGQQRVHVPSKQPCNPRGVVSHLHPGGDGGGGVSTRCYTY